VGRTSAATGVRSLATIHTKETKMLRIHRHGVEDYEQLSHIATGDLGILSVDDRECLREVGNFLAATDAWKRFALWLLHKHFEPQDTELFFERVIFDEKRTETSPVCRSRITKHASPVAIRFRDDSGPAPRVVGLKYANLHPREPTAALDDRDEPVLAGIAHRLGAYEKLDRFGVRLIRSALAIMPSEIMFESCDSRTRTMHCHVASRTEVPADVATIETAWRWRLVGANRPVVIQDCTACCSRAVEEHDLTRRYSEIVDSENQIVHAVVKVLPLGKRKATQERTLVTYVAERSDTGSYGIRTAETSPRAALGPWPRHE
jgi:hypothetical protein